MREGSLTLMTCYLYSKSLNGLQTVFNGAHARERERELLYHDACGGTGRGWISQGIESYGRGHGARETCALHTAKLSSDTLVDFWSAVGEETRFSLLRIKEEDFMERLMFRKRKNGSFCNNLQKWANYIRYCYWRPATLFDYGSGHADPVAALNLGVVYDTTVDDYLNFLSALNYTSKYTQLSIKTVLTVILDLNHQQLASMDALDAVGS
ncbi:hypothetical protein RYX36_021589 [Vicia faba]